MITIPHPQIAVSTHHKEIVAQASPYPQSPLRGQYGLWMEQALQEDPAWSQGELIGQSVDERGISSLPKAAAKPYNSTLRHIVWI